MATLPLPIRAVVREHLLISHTSLDQVGQVAEQARAKTLVLTHLIGAVSPSQLERIGHDFSGRAVAGEDLMSLGIHTRRKRRR